MIPTAVFDTYWHFAAERQKVFFRRAAGLPQPWTSDPILLKYRFTNAYRAADRVSQYLIQHVQAAGPQDHRSIFFRTILFKLFNRIETWQLLDSALGPPGPGSYVFSAHDRVLTDALRRGERIYSGAYIMPSGGGQWGHKHRAHLKLLEALMRDQVLSRIVECGSMREAFQLLRSYPLIGDFLAYQYVIDLNYAGVLDFSEMDFVVPGPGARSGIRKCFRDCGRYSDADVIRWTADRQQEEFAKRGLDFLSLWGRPLQLVDCQNLFCEIDKYERVAHPEIPGLFGRVRIKRAYRPNPEPIEYWFPPKWGLNERIAQWKRAANPDPAFMDGGTKGPLSGAPQE